MFAGLLSFAESTPPSSSGIPALILAMMGALVVTPIVSIHKYFAHMWLAWINTFVLLSAAGAVLLTLPEQRQQEVVHLEAILLWPPAIVIVTLFLLNGVCPYLGLKFDFSLAMFSGLDPLRDNHYFLRLPARSFMPTYLVGVSVSDARGLALPEQTNRSFPTRPSQAFSVAYVRSVARGLGDRYVITAVDSSGSQWLLSGQTSNHRLRLRDRVSTYPFSLPLSPDVPLCI
jgi:hypothetical protein